MKLSAKPISSPGRMEKFPPPLMRFLKSNAANKSRGRTRSKSNSMFLILRKKNTTSIETKEPSSPKVTCMGQVRVKRSSKQPTTKKGRPSSGDGAPSKCRCPFWWVPHTLFCCHFVRKDSVCCFGFRRKSKASKVSEASMKNGSKESYIEEEEEEEEEENNRVFKAKVLVSDSNDSSTFCSTPPKNALLLTRCKSAPYSSSSLASRFWGSPLRNEETEQPSEEKQSESVSVSKLRFFKELEDSARERITESEKVCEMKRKEETEEGESIAFPLVLTRCKSERARKS
ncbi:hypothetical protein MtrunA17_Chr1g0181531 [Medicago truncatula]|uniref:Protamine P1 family protein n=1 Tax=Medicago truncatula TaxID=3880 RepID=A0A072VW07_MEDTR|nr:hypothetical protein MTR_1g066750 [Medicago truncatula]RHN79824.1 hypothetical protein MtrunA17_Chr1g0181531 [Medicago truncatula]